MDNHDYLFVLGTGCCGSTLVHEVLARHDRVAFLSNLDDRFGPAARTTRWNRSIYNAVPQRLTKKGRVRFAPSEGYRALEREVSPVLSFPDRPLRHDDATPWLSSRFREFLERRARLQGGDVFVHKFTGFSRAGFVDAVLPNARFVHVVRDGRAVASSLFQKPWWHADVRRRSGWYGSPLPADRLRDWEQSGRNHVLLAGLTWQLMLEGYRDGQELVGDERWLELRFEDIVADPVPSFSAMADHAGLRMTSDFAAEVERYTFESSKVLGYRDALDRNTRKLLEASIGPTLARYGYEPEF